LPGDAVPADHPPQVKDKLPEKLPQTREGTQQLQTQHAGSFPRSAPATKKDKGSQRSAGRGRRRKRRQ
jgi:hypothetical protein